MKLRAGKRLSLAKTDQDADLARRDRATQATTTTTTTTERHVLKVADAEARSKTWVRTHYVAFSIDYSRGRARLTLGPLPLAEEAALLAGWKRKRDGKLQKSVPLTDLSKELAHVGLIFVRH